MQPVHRFYNLSCCFVLDDSHWIKVVWNLAEVLACIPLGTKYIKQFLPYLLAICIASSKNSPFRPTALCCCSFVFYRLIRFIAGILFFFSFLRAAFTCDWQFPLLCKSLLFLNLARQFLFPTCVPRPTEVENSPCFYSSRGGVFSPLTWLGSDLTVFPVWLVFKELVQRKCNKGWELGWLLQAFVFWECSSVGVGQLSLYKKMKFTG